MSTNTVLIASLFNPTTVHFDLPGNRSPRPSRAGGTKKTQKRPKLEVHQPSLFPVPPKGAETPPQTPVDDDDSVILGDSASFVNEDGARVHITIDGQDVFGPTDKESPKWGARPDQPKSRANSPPPAALLRQSQELLQKAEELGRQGINQPRTTRSESHDRVFTTAPWRIVKSDQGNGGLRNAVSATQRDGLTQDITWIGTTGMPMDAIKDTQQEQDIIDRLATDHNTVVVKVSDKDLKGAYVHYCKDILWPVFHYQIPDNPKSKAFEDHSWKYYVNLNQAFANTIIKNYKRGDVIVVNDYHLLLVPAMIRSVLPDAMIGLFLHVAFPSSEVFRCLPTRNKILEGMLGANLIGFQIPEYNRHFLQTCSRLMMSVEVTAEGVQLEDRFVNVMSNAIGIDPISLDAHRQETEVQRWIETIREKYEGKKIIVARDKLDYVRGVREKLLSYELFLNENPEWRDKVVLIQVALSTSEKTDLDAAVGDIVNRVNSSFASLARQPVLYLRQDIPYPQYLALMTHADALMITSQREGMNLTSHEFVFCQDGKFSDKKHGPLILSEFTGTHDLFSGNQLSVNPWSYRQIAGAIKKSLEMSDEEKSRRWKGLQEDIRDRTGGNWFSDYLVRLRKVYDEQHRHHQSSVPRLSVPNLQKRYMNSNRRLFFFDLEGSLLPNNVVGSSLPMNPQRTIAVLNDLVVDPRNTVYVMSSRRPDELDRLFRLVPYLGLIAENGCFVKDANSSKWTDVADRQSVATWKESVRPILQYYIDRTPGASLEDRQCSLIFQYKDAEDFANAERQASDWVTHVNESCQDQRVHANQSENCVVVEPIDWTRENAAAKIHDGLAHLPGVEKAGPIDFMMVVGDGREDEKVFRWANGLSQEKAVQNVFTVSQGNRNTEASATLGHGASGVLATLQKLVGTS